MRLIDQEGKWDCRGGFSEKKAAKKSCIPIPLREKMQLSEIKKRPVSEVEDFGNLFT